MNKTWRTYDRINNLNSIHQTETDGLHNKTVIIILDTWELWIENIISKWGQDTECNLYFKSHRKLFSSW